MGNNAALGTGTLVMAGGTTLQAAADNLTLTNLVTLSGAGTIDTEGRTLRLNGVVSGAGGSIVKVDDGTLNLFGANSFDGGVQLNQGTLGVGNNAALGTGTLAMAGGTTLQAAADNLTLGNAITVTGLGTVDTGSYTLTLDDTVSGTGALNKDGTGTLILKDNSNLTSWDVLAGTLDNRAALVASTAMAMSGANTTLLNAAGASVTVAGGAGTILGAAGSQGIDNAGIMNAAVALGGEDDSYILRASGSQTGTVAGEGGTADFLQIETGSGATRTIAAAAFTGFEHVQLNLDTGSTGTIALAAASDPAAEATLDTGGGAGTSVALNRGILNLETANSSLRAANVTVVNGAVLSGVGQVFNGPGGLTTNAGIFSPGNSSGAGAVPGSSALGRISLAGNYAQTPDGTFFVDFKPDSLAANRTSDVLVLSGNATLSGVVRASQWSGTVVNTEQQFVIMETAGGVIAANGLTLQLEGDLNYEGYSASLEVIGGNQLVLKFTASAPPPPPPPDEGSDLRPQPYLQVAMAGVLGAQSFSDALMGCRERDGTYAYIADSQCIWLDSGAGYLDRSASGNQVGADQTAWWLGGGAQLALSDTVSGGIGLRYEDVSQNVHDNAHSDGW